MKELTAYCDRCGKALSKMNDYDDIDIEAAHYFKHVDLCSPCFDKLTDTIECFFTKTEDITTNESL